MRHLLAKYFLVVVGVGSLCISLGLSRVTAQAPNGNRANAASQERPDTKMLLEDAMSRLEEARKDLKSADTDKAGHKVKAETLVDNAMNEVQATLKADYPGKK